VQYKINKFSDNKHGKYTASHWTGARNARAWRESGRIIEKGGARL